MESLEILFKYYVKMNIICVLSICLSIPIRASYATGLWNLVPIIILRFYFIVSILSFSKEFLIKTFVWGKWYKTKRIQEKQNQIKPLKAEVCQPKICNFNFYERSFLWLMVSGVFLSLLRVIK